MSDEPVPDETLSIAWGNKVLSVHGLATLLVVVGIAIIAGVLYNGHEITTSVEKVGRAVEASNQALVTAIREDVASSTREHKEMTWEIKLSSCIHTLDDETKRAVRHSPNTPWQVWCWWVDEAPGYRSVANGR